MPLAYRIVQEILRAEQFIEVANGYFVYHPEEASPWLLYCPPDPEGYIDVIPLIRNILRPTPYIDVQQRLVRRIEQALNPTP